MMINALMKRLAEDGSASAGSSAQHQNSVPASRRGNNRKAIPAGINLVGAELQRKFAAGIDYNMKILIRGDRNTGKTALWRRLQGLSFMEDSADNTYTQTEEIQVTSITWNYRARDFVVKLDVWDVVDKGRRTADLAESVLKFGFGRKSTSSAPACDVPAAVQEVIGKTACDASTVNVYNGCNGVIFMFDVTREWTWAYVQRELPTVPSSIPVLVMANKMDLIEPTQPTPSTIEQCLRFLRIFNERVSTSSGGEKCVSPVRFAKSSMKCAQGLKYLYNFFNIPFLLLQRNFLKNAIEANLREMQIAEDELDILAREEGQNPSMWRHKSAEWERQKSKESREGTDYDDEEEEEEEDEEDEVALEDGDWMCQQQQKLPTAGENGTTIKGNPKSKTNSGEQHKPTRKIQTARPSSSSSEGANPHVSTYAEDIDD